jgi:aryl-alcohol dehydrogenase-like predicted oxidoreductase
MLRTMRKRKLGSGGLEVSVTGVGCMGMSRAFAPIPDPLVIALIRNAVTRDHEDLDRMIGL